MHTSSEGGDDVTVARISVCIPAWNAERYLRTCINSALASPAVGEVVVLDDASTDRTLEVASAVSDPRVRVLRHASNLGRAANIQRAFSEASCDYVVVLPADDELVAEGVDALLELLEQSPDTTFAFGAVEIVDSRGTHLRHHRPFPNPWLRAGGAAVRSLLPHDPVLTTAALIRRTALEASGGLRVDIAPSHRDWDLFLRLAACGRVAYTPRVVARDRSHSMNFTDQIRGSDRAGYYELLILDAFGSWAQGAAPHVIDDLLAGRRAWARSKFAESIMGRAGMRTTTPAAMLGLGLVAHPQPRSEPRMWAAAAALMVPGPIVRALRPLLRRLAR